MKEKRHWKSGKRKKILQKESENAGHPLARLQDLCTTGPGNLFVRRFYRVTESRQQRVTSEKIRWEMRNCSGVLKHMYEEEIFSTPIQCWEQQNTLSAEK